MVGAAALAIGFSQNGIAGRPAARIQAILKKKKPCNSLNCKAFYLGWLMGLEPTTTGITILDSTN